MGRWLDASHEGLQVRPNLKCILQSSINHVTESMLQHALKKYNVNVSLISLLEYDMFFVLKCHILIENKMFYRFWIVFFYVWKFRRSVVRQWTAGTCLYVTYMHMLSKAIIGMRMTDLVSLTFFQNLDTCCYLKTCVLKFFLTIYTLTPGLWNEVFPYLPHFEGLPKSIVACHFDQIQ